MRVLPTEYRGYRFRSRLEARWAVYYDHLGIEWVYEPEGFNLGNDTFYLPDFWLPEQKCFVEIKPVRQSEASKGKYYRLSEGTGYDVYLFVGSIKNPAVSPDWWWDGFNSADKFFARGEGWDTSHYWCRCDRCGQYGIEFEGRWGRIRCGCPKEDDRASSFDLPLFVEAQARAATHRFIK